MHTKRQTAPKTWTIPRKGTKYIVKPNFSKAKGVPVLVVLRDMLNLAQNRREVKKALHKKNILLNSNPVTDEKNNALLFDVITIVPSKKHYRIEITNKGRFYAKDIETEFGKKVSKIIGKKILKGKKVQLNLSDGRNFLSDLKCNMGDSALIDFKENKIERCIPLQGGCYAIVIAGKHAGKVGQVKSIDTEKKTVEMINEESDINVLIKQIMAIENKK